MKSLKFILITCVFLTACNAAKNVIEEPVDRASLGDMDEIPEVSQSYKASYDDVWKAALTVVQETGNPLQIINKEGGIFVTKWVMFDKSLFIVYRHCFVVRVAEQDDNQVKVSIQRAVQAVKKKRKRPIYTDGGREVRILYQIKQELK